MRFFTLTTLERRSGTSFQLKSGLITIGTMLLNGSKACHEMELSEPDYLKHAKSIAQLCRVPGCAVYVSTIREVAEQAKDDEVEADQEQDTDREEEKEGAGELTKDTPFFTLRAIAKREGVDISTLTTNADRAAAINEARKLAVA